MLPMNKNTFPEILAPAGNFASLHAAIQAGADAVYFGINQLNMRVKNAACFTLDELEEVVSVTHQAGLKAYLTLNTVIYDEEIDLVKKIIEKAKLLGIDAIIASDMAVIQYAFQKKLPVHISTQCSVSNIEAVRFYSQFSDRIVLARELTLEKITSIITEIENQQIKGPNGSLLEIECFAHGAMCVAVSGRCYMSLYHYNHSANRGECIQPCRRQYEVTDLETGKQLVIDKNFVMSPKDLNTLPFLNRLVQSGISVLKIEGRTRSPEYVLTVVSCYRRALAAIKENCFDKPLIDELQKELDQVYHRGYSDGFYLGYNPDQWTEKYGTHATHRKEYCAKILHYFSSAKIAHIKLESCDLHLGDECMIIGPSTGVLRFNLTELMVDDQPASMAKKGDEATIPVPDRIRLSDKLYVFKKI